MARKRRRFTAEFKARVALDALRERDSVRAIAARHELHPNLVSAWKRQLPDMPEAFTAGGGWKLAQEHEAKIHDLHAKIGELTGERVFFSARAEALIRAERMGMIGPGGPLNAFRSRGKGSATLVVEPRVAALGDLAKLGTTAKRPSAPRDSTSTLSAAPTREPSCTSASTQRSRRVRLNPAALKKPSPSRL